jgi:hypothetical protein
MKQGHHCDLMLVSCRLTTLLFLLIFSIASTLCRVRENPNGGGFQVFESTKFFEFTNATEFLFEWVNNVGNSVNQGPLYEEAQDFGGGVVYVLLLCDSEHT